MATSKPSPRKPRRTRSRRATPEPREPQATRRRPHQDRSRGTVQVILQAAEDILVREGWEGLTTNRVAERAGVSVGSLYQYFSNKEALVDALLEAHLEQHMALLASVGPAMAGQGIEDAVRGYVRLMFLDHADKPRKQLALFEHLPRAHGWEAVMQLNRRMQDVVATFLRAHQHRIRPRNAELAAMLLVVSVDAILHATLLRDPAMLRDAAVHQEVAQLVLGYLGLGDRAANSEGTGAETPVRREVSWPPS